MSELDLFYTPRSHFARKVRIVAQAYDIPLRLHDVGDVANVSTAQFASNPLMKVPALVDGSQLIIDSDHIASYLVRHRCPDDRFNVLTDDATALNTRAVLNGAMAAEVELVLARRTGIDTAAYARFDKLLATIRTALHWLEERADTFDDEPSYGGFHLVCLWDHLAFCGLVELPHPRLAAVVERLSDLPYVASSAPSIQKPGLRETMAAT